MKRRTVKALVCAAFMAMSLSLTACGGSDDAAKSADAATEEETPAEEEAPVEEETPAAEEEAPVEEEVSEAETGSGETLEDYLGESPEEKKQLEESLAETAPEGVAVSVDVKGNEFYYVYTIEDEALMTDELVTNIKTGMDALESVFEMMAGQLDEVVGEKGAVTLIVKYVDPDGNVLDERSFQAAE